MTQGQGEPWKWSYNRMIGIMYGPIPVGIIVIAIVAVAYFASK
jgi:type IV secretory pathway VirB2 component (pilin)